MTDTRLTEVLSGRQDNYILPFFWQHGEDESTLREYMAAIQGANIGAVCVEARPHPDFAGPKWWQDLDIVMDEARKRHMRVWVLDDAHFPTGQAAGAMEHAPEELCKQYLNYHELEVCGPQPGSTLDVSLLARYIPSPLNAMSSPFPQPEPRVFTDDALFAVVAARLSGAADRPMAHLDGELVDLTPLVTDGTLVWDVPAGMWKIFVIYTTRNGGGATNYINMLSRKSCRVQIDTVYEPHFAHYAADFGRTFAGFFSDEPAVGNVTGFSRDILIGTPHIPLAWSGEMAAAMRARFGADYRRLIPALWADVGEKAFTADVRVGYMDEATRLVKENFGDQLGDWCRAHGVEYIGHIIEDVDMSVRFGASMGHFFRALWGQDMSGIDDIGGQVQPGGENRENLGFLGMRSDGEFYHNALGKLGASLAHIDPKKKGRAMCELYGAYGWSEGTRLLKYLTDHFLVRGINRFVPHAFSPAPFPDPDCPPHFYAHGENPLYPHFGQLMLYTNRLAHLLDGGVHHADVALLYHAEAEWSGGAYRTFHGPARQLLERQIDFDVVPADLFSDMAAFDASFDGLLRIGRETYRALVVPGAEFLLDAVLDFAKTAAKAGFPVYVTDLAPEGLPAESEVCPLSELADRLVARGIYDLRLDADFPNLRAYHCEQPDGSYYMLSNEDAWRTFDGGLTLPSEAEPFIYDAMDNRLYRLPREGAHVRLRLPPYASVVLVQSKDASDFSDCAVLPSEPQTRREIAGPWRVTFAAHKPYTDFSGAERFDTLHNVLLDKPAFSGVVRYENTFTLTAEEARELTHIQFEDAYEAVTLRVNGVDAGMRLCPPYRFAISGLIRAGENTLTAEVATTLDARAHAIQPMGLFGPDVRIMAPSGLIGRVWLQA